MFAQIKKHVPFPIKSRLISLSLIPRQKVDFAVAGFPKCATTSIGQKIATAKGIFLPGYEVQMQHLISGKIEKKGEKDLFGIRNPNLIYEMHNLKALINKNPRIRIILSMRDPTSWLYSFYQYRRMEILNNSPWIQRHLKKMPNLCNVRFDDILYNGQSLMGVTLKKGNFVFHINKLLKYLPPTQILILFLEELAQNPDNTYKKIFHFLNIDYDSVPDKPIKANENNPFYEPKSLYQNQLKYLDDYFKSMKDELNALLELRWGIKNDYW